MSMSLLEFIKYIGVVQKDGTIKPLIWTPAMKRQLEFLESERKKLKINERQHERQHERQNK